MGIPVIMAGITHMAITGRIRTMAIIGLHSIGTAGTGIITATMVTTTIITGNKVT
jgi:hypothetical protein